MTSDKNIVRLNEYLDGLLSAKESREFEIEINQKPELAKELAELLKVFNQLEELEDLEPSRDLSVKVLQQLEFRREKSKPLVWLLSFELVAVIALLVISWPTIAAPLIALTRADIVLPNFSDLLANLLTPHAEFWESIQLSISSDLAQYTNAPSTGLLSIDLLWVALGVILVGLFGNGVLLRPKRIDRAM